MPLLNMPRRQWLQSCLAGSTALASLTLPRATQAQSGSVTPRLVQLIDTSPEHQNLSRDYATGVRLAWAGDGARRPAPRTALQVLEINALDPARSAREVVLRLMNDPGVIGLVGTTGDALAVAVHEEIRRHKWAVPHIGPWMADARFDEDTTLACLFASRRVQMMKGLASVRGMGMNELCVVYRSPAERTLYDTELARLAQASQLRLVRVTAGAGLAAAAAQIPASSSLVMCMGSSADLAQLTQGMAARQDRRFVLGLSDADANSLLEFRPGKGVSVILTQVVPNPAKNTMPQVALVGEYRTRLKQLFDEAPNAVSLAGYIAGSYAAELLQNLGGRPAREALLAEVERRASLNLRGWQIDFREDKRGSRFVTQLMLGADGQLVG